MSTPADKSSRKTLNGLYLAAALLFLLAMAITGYKYYNRYFAGNVTNVRPYLYVHTGATVSEVLKTVKDSGIVKNVESFEWAVSKMNYRRVKPGRYTLQEGMSNRRLINMLKSGNQEPVKLRFQGKRLKEDFAILIGSRLEVDSVELLRMLNSEDSTAKYGFTPDNIYAMFLPNSYELYWNTSASQFVQRMSREYTKFWNAQRTAKAKAINLTPVQVSILAAIVDAEALHDDEMPTIAGLYLNRLKSGQKLESDPTVIFANKDFTIRRVLNRHLAVISPYNTYTHTGLPPGPIMMPSISAIDAVLNYRPGNYLFMCAKEDFSGYHNFAATRAEHEKNAAKYRHALDLRNIRN